MSAPDFLKAQPLIIASHNKGKVREIGELIEPLDIRVLSAAEAGVDEPEETGLTFAENSELKARHALAVTGMAALADDSGLATPALGGAPGIYSARWAGPDKDFTVAFERIQRELGTQQNVPAYFVCDLCLAFPGGDIEHFEGKVHGTLTFPPRGDQGFGYDPIFIPEGHAGTFGELSADIKNEISHRSRAFAKFLAFLHRA